MSQSMIVAGVMSGTSADGIDVALVKISEMEGSRQPGGAPNIRLLGYASYPYSANVRRAILSAMNASSASVADLARLNSLLGELYADAVLGTQRRLRVKAELVGCHGQTLYHQSETRPFLGRKVSTTWQTGEAATIAARVGVPVVSDFRPADMAAGGKGAPLVPYLDYLWFRDERIGRIVQNIGGIANLTAIPAGGDPEDTIAFDTGPGNMVIDAVMQELFGKGFDRSGKTAASGRVLDSIVDRILGRKFFLAKPPKSAGREEFGREFVRQFLRECRGSRKQDIVATATFLTARSISDAIERFIVRRFPISRKSEQPHRLRSRQAIRVGSERVFRVSSGQEWDASLRRFSEIVLSGGGARNSTLVAMLVEQLAPLGITVRFSDQFGLPSEAKEAVAFAVLAYETWNRRPSNVPAATGAKRPAVLGKISYA